MGNQLNREAVIRELEQTEALIQKASALRNKAEGTKESYEEQLKQTEAELRKLGTSPEEAENDLLKLKNEIEKELELIKAEVPIDLLRDLKQI